MADEKSKYQGMYCCTVPMDGVRTLNFPDGTQSGVFGLDEILASVYGEGREADDSTAEVIVERLSAKNYIVPSARQKYVDLLREEYEKYVLNVRKASPATIVAKQRDEGAPRKGLLSRLLLKTIK